MKNRLEKLLIIAPKLFFQYCQPAQNKSESHILFYKNGFLSDSYIMILSTSMTCACHCILACILCTVHFLYCRSLSGRVFQFCKWRWKFSTKNSLLDGWKCHLNRHLLPKLAQCAFNPHKIVRLWVYIYHHSDILSSTPFHITMSWELWKHPDPVPGVRPMFFKPKLHKESKNGFKTISYRPSPVMFFLKNCFWSNKTIKKIGCFVDFCIFMAIYMDKLDQF